MSHLTKWILFAFLAIFSLNIVLTTFNQPIKCINASILRVEEDDITYPRLFVTKTVDRFEVEIGEDIVVTVTIENFGNNTAYNVTFIDQFNPSWVFEESGLAQLSYGQIGVNETRRFSHLIRTKSVGTHKILAAQIEYYDSELGLRKYTTISNSVEITVTEPLEDFTLKNINTAITLLIIIVVLDIILLFRPISQKLRRNKV